MIIHAAPLIESSSLLIALRSTQVLKPHLCSQEEHSDMVAYQILMAAFDEEADTEEGRGVIGRSCLLILLIFVIHLGEGCGVIFGWGVRERRCTAVCEVNYLCLY